MITSSYSNGRLEIFVNDEFNCSYNDITENSANEILEHFKFMYQMWN